MPMGDCDRFKKHISDYLEGSLDKTTRKEFESELEQNDELSKLTSRIGEISILLSKLPDHKCSDDFSAKLRKKIHNSDSRAKLPVTPLKKYSFAFSFAILAVIIVFTLNVFDNNSGDTNVIPESSNLQNSNPQPSPQIPSQPVSNIPAVSNKEVDIKTVDEQKAVTDSVKKEEKSASEKNFKYVDDKKK
jgi:hypothetical protein